MRVLVQRATNCRGLRRRRGRRTAPQPGLLVLIGVTHTDTPAIAARLAEKTWTPRILAGERSCAEVAAPVLVVSQFTLYADTRKGRRPSWSAAASGPVSEPLVVVYVEALRSLGAHVLNGVFGADMQVSLVNDGPITILLDSADLDRPRR